MKKSCLLATVAACAFGTAAMAEDAPKVFSLGEITATTPAANGGDSGGTDIGGSVITHDDLTTFNRDTLDKAITLAPGTSVSVLGPRNETNIWIRGYDRWRVPLYQDGIPIYLPYDNRIDSSQFTSSTVGEIQVTKGYTSVIDGPGAIGGSVNLVSRKVTKPLEGDGRVGFSFDGSGAFNGLKADAFGGTRQDKWYFQADATEQYQTHYALSDSFTSQDLQAAGDRLNSRRDAYSFNVKAGYVPNATDEYAINIVTGNSTKNTPPPDINIPPNKLTSVKYWNWPSWDKQSVYWLSQTAIDDDGSTLKTRAYYDRYYNSIMMYDNNGYNTQNTTASAFSQYDDRAAGGTVELNEMLWGGRDEVRMASIFRYDQHNEKNNQYSASGLHWYETPWETGEENTYSQAIENTFHPAKDWDWKVGLSYDYRQMIGDTQWVASGSTAPYGYNYQYKVANKEALNYQTALVYHYTPTGAVHASFSDRSRFPTLFEMYSTRFSTFIQNPYLKPEEGLTWETGWSDTIDDTHLGVNVYWSKLLNAIETVAVNSSTSQSQNVGVEYHKGFEVEASHTFSEQFKLGGNYSFIQRDIAYHFTVPTETPKHRFFGYAQWTPLEGLDIIPSADISSKRWLQSYLSQSTYLRSGDYAVVNLKAAYQIRTGVSFEIGANNLTDQNYVLADGYNSQGRNYFTNLRVTF